MTLSNTLGNVLPYDENSYQKLSNIFDKAYTELSFWGGRRVYVPGNSGYVPLEVLCKKITELVDAHPEFSETQREIGLSMQKNLEKLYETSEAQIEKSFFLTRFFISIYRLFGSTQADPFSMGVSDYRHFDYYTFNQCKSVIGKEPIGTPAGFFRRNHSDGEVKTWLISKKNLTNKR